MHKSAGHNGLILGDHLVAVAALKPLLVLVAVVVAVLHLQEVPHHAVLPYRGHEMPLLLSIFRYLHNHRTTDEGSMSTNAHAGG